LKIGYKYDAWGNADSYCSNPNDLLSAITATLFFILNPFTYRGYFYDAESNIYYLQSRYYIPEWGRFLNADVYCDTGTGTIGTNMFAYCDNEPVLRRDAFGYYSSSAATTYAKKWWNLRNIEYKDYGGADCTNFVSQCVYAGGISEMTYISKHPWFHKKFWIWAQTGPFNYTQVYYYKASSAWINVKSFKYWLQNYGHASKEIIIKKSSEIKDKIKDLSTNHCTFVIFFMSSDPKINTDPETKKEKTKYSHAAINGIVDKENGNVYYYAHSDSYNCNAKKRGIREVLDSGKYCQVSLVVLK